MKIVQDILCFNGRQLRLSHQSSSCQCEMHFSLFLPPQAKSKNVPLVTWLSGLTCTDENFVIKAGAQRIASSLGLAILTPDTSPRGDMVARPEDNSWDLGPGAGFYLDATETPWQQHYQMESYISDELPLLLENSEFNLDLNLQSICGHSMGGHGALTLGIKNPQRYRCISAFAPICAPTQAPWGQKAFSNYLGNNETTWQNHDSCELIKQLSYPHPILIDQGELDPFLNDQLKPELLKIACQQQSVNLNLRLQPGYDHSYFFIASFLEDHLKFHAKHLSQDIYV